MAPPGPSFTVEYTDGAARTGIVRTAHGFVHTPAFMPVGTQGSVKGVAPSELRALGVEMVLANAYHLSLRPGVEVIQEAGGLHKFMGWWGPLLTDSGGYQILSLAPMREVTEGGVRFRSHHDGSLHLFSPERVVEVQGALKADIAMVLDECPPYAAGRDAIGRAADRTVRWARRAREAFGEGPGSLYAIVQGGTHEDLRRACAAALVEQGFPGWGIGGLSVGEPKELTWAMVEAVVEELPNGTPRYLMGVGYPIDLLEGIGRGVDLFDCVAPTRVARNGTVFTREGTVTLRNAVWARDRGPIEEGCLCEACRSFSRSYVRHLFNAGEILGLRLATVHNLHFVLSLLREAREAIAGGRFAVWGAEVRVRLGGVEAPLTPSP